MALFISSGCSGNVDGGTAEPFVAPSSGPLVPGVVATDGVGAGVVPNPALVPIGGMPVTPPAASAAAETPGLGTPAATGPDTTGLSPTPANDPLAPAAGSATTSLPYTEPTPAAPALEARTWKLTHAQYAASIQDFVGIAVELEGANGPRLAPETSNGVFLNLSDSGFVSIANGLAQGYLDIAGEVSEALSEEQLVAVSGCNDLSVACRDGFLGSVITKAFRRPASAEDLATFGELFDAAQAEVAAVGDEAFAYRSVIKGLLTSPYFLYRTEIGTDAAQVEFQMTPHEVASFLSYSVHGRPPSVELVAAAAAGTLLDPGALRTQVEALLAEPEAADEFQRFMVEWLEVEAFLDQDFGLGREGSKNAPGFDDVKEAMLGETMGFLAQHGTLDGSLVALLTQPVVSQEPALAEFYASEGSAVGGDTTRVGLVALGSGLSLKAKEASTSPTLRGLFVRERFLCQDFDVPAGVIPDLTELEAQVQPETTRELYELHALSPECDSCHKMFDNIGYTLESFDEVGRFRTAQNGVAIDTSAPLLATDVDRQMQNHADLAQALSESTWVRECLARQAFRFYFGTATALEVNADGKRPLEDRGLPPIQSARVALESGTLRALVTALLSSESTSQRTRAEPLQR